MNRFVFLLIMVAAVVCNIHQGKTQTVALWLFDEERGLYPSHVLSDQSDNDYPLVIGPGGSLVEGKFGNALEPLLQPQVTLPAGEVEFGLKQLPIPPGRTVEPMSWMNAKFCALMTSSENHLRKEVGFANATSSDLNLGDFDWTVEFWFKPGSQTGEDGVVFELGEGPRGENEKVTRLLLSADMQSFKFINYATGTEAILTTGGNITDTGTSEWHHLAFSYDQSGKRLSYYRDGRLQDTVSPFKIKALDRGEEAYFSLCRDGKWQHPLQGAIDELRFSRGLIYEKDFTPPASFSPLYSVRMKPAQLVQGPPLLFGKEQNHGEPINLENRRHLFIDDALVQKMENVNFMVNPPRLAERVIEGIEGPFRKHLTIVEDEQGLIRLYNSIHDDRLAIRTSRDGVHWEVPDVGRGEYRGQKNIVIPEPVGGLGNPFIDPNGPPEQRWKYLTGFHDRGIFLYTSPDGWTWTRIKTAHISLRSGTQSCTFYDDQRQLYISYHRTGINRTPQGATQRESVVTETDNLFQPLRYRPVTPQDYLEASKTMRLREPLPWYLDNGPLTPGGFGIEFPHKFAPIDTLDPPEFDMYVTKAIKYPWAPDTYLAFPISYFHYEVDSPLTRQILMDPKRGRGSGPVETQLAVSRDGLNWKRYPRPAYVGNGMHAGWPVNQAYLAQGMVRRGNEIWQYYFGTEIYHSSYSRDESKSAVYRVIQRLDGFVSADTPYDRTGYLITRPLVFAGNRLLLNIDTDATGYAQVGFLDAEGKPVPGFSVDDCIYINGDFVDTTVEWLNNGVDISELAGQLVQMVFRMRGTKLYSMQFVQK